MSKLALGAERQHGEDQICLNSGKVVNLIDTKSNIRRQIVGEDLVLRSRDMGRAIAVRRWTNTALECYKRGCMCEGCFYADFFSGTSQKCQMKASVLELVRVLGKPDVDMPQVLAD